MTGWCFGGPNIFYVKLRAQTGCSLVQAHRSPSHTDWLWVLAEAHLSSGCVTSSLVTLTVISLQ